MIGNVTSFDIDFYLIYLLSKALLHYIDNATGLSKKTSSPSKNVYDLEDIFLLIDTYATQVI